MTRFVIEHSPYQRNEEPVIHVAKKWLEFVTGGKASNQEYPDKIKGLQSEVETTFFIDNTKYALEHTCIEAFSGELRSDSFWNSQFGLKIKELEKRIEQFFTGIIRFRINFA